MQTHTYPPPLPLASLSVVTLSARSKWPWSIKDRRRWVAMTVNSSLLLHLTDILQVTKNFLKICKKLTLVALKHRMNQYENIVQ